MGGAKASVVAFELFKNACDIMDSREFSTWYERHVAKLFSKTTSKQIKLCLDKNDPRLSPDFLFPEDVCFLPNCPVAYGLFRGSYAEGFQLLSGSPELSKLVGLDLARGDREIRFFDNLLESKVLDLFSHLVYKKKVAEGSIRPLDYFFQTIVRLPGGLRMIVRVHCYWLNSEVGGDEDKMHVKLQDVSELYPNILNLPPLPY